MARKPNPFPVPNLRPRNDAFQIRWMFRKKRYEFSIGTMSKGEAKKLLTAIAAALAERHEWPDEVINIPTVKRYIADKNNTTTITDGLTLIEKYITHMRANHDSTWPNNVKAYLLKAQEFIGGNLQNASTETLHAYLDNIAERHKVTRNRTAAAISGFFHWLRIIGQHPKNHNPMAGIKRIREDKSPEGIIIWENNEIQKLLNAADCLRDGIAIWIAILGGLRRSEIARLRVEDITPAYIIIRKSKTDVKRQIPLSKILAERLNKEPRISPRIVPWPEAFHGWETAAGRLIYERLPKLLPAIHAKHPEKFGWNPFRHTFASRHAQAGTPIDVIAAWLGDSPKVCKEHYARYVPANMRDTRIDAADPKL